MMESNRKSIDIVCQTINQNISFGFIFQLSKSAWQMIFQIIHKNHLKPRARLLQLLQWFELCLIHDTNWEMKKVTFYFLFLISKLYLQIINTNINIISHNLQIYVKVYVLCAFKMYVSLLEVCQNTFHTKKAQT